LNKDTITVVLYVDDLLDMLKEKKYFTWLADKLDDKYNGVERKREISDDVSYLGMMVRYDRDTHTLEVDMINYITELFREHRVKKTKIYNTPSGNNLFEEKATHKSGNRKEFHTVVAKLLYLSKKARPDILLAVLYLCTRVQDPGIGNDQKLTRVLGYLMGTHKLTRKFDSNIGDRVVLHIDAAFSCHEDGKGNSATVSLLEDNSGITIYRKQKIATPNSMESELVALSDLIFNGEWLNEFMKGQDFGLKKPLIYQDNNSIITLVETKCLIKMRKRQIRARRASVYKDVVVNERFEQRWKITKEMLADVLTKLLQDSRFKDLRGQIMK